MPALEIRIGSAIAQSAAAPEHAAERRVPGGNIPDCTEKECAERNVQKGNIP